MATLTGQTIASSYEQLLHCDTDGGGNTTTLVPVKDGDNGTIFAAQLSTTTVCVDNPTTSSSTQGGILRLQSDDGAVMASGHRLGVIEFGGAEDTSSTITTGARIEAVTDATWSASENGAYLSFYTTDGNASETEALRIDSAGVKAGSAGSGIDTFLYTAGTAAHVGIQWDADGNTEGTLIGGADDHGVDFKFFGETSGAYIQWDMSSDDLVLAGAAGIDLAGDLDVDGTSNLDIVDIDGAVDMASTLQLDGTLTVSANDTGADVRFYSATDSEGLLYDASEDELGLLLTTKLSFHDIGGDENILASADGHLEVNSGTTLDITAPTVDVNASTAITLDGDVLVGNGKSVVIGHTAQETVSVDDGDTDLVPEVQVLGTHMADSSILLGCWANSGAIAGAPSLCFAKSRNATIGSHSRVSDNDQIGNIIWFGDDGVDLESPVCQIQGEIDDDPDTGDMPGRILFFTTTGGGEVLTERLRISSSGTASFSGNVNITGAVSKGSGSFKIDHPLPSMKDTHHLVHSFTESPRADLIYRDKVTLVDGSAIINIDTVAGMTEGTFVLLCDNVQCFTSNESDWSAVKGSVSGNILTIECEDSSSTADVAWMVVGDRQDEHIMDTNWTDENGKPIIEPEKPIIEPEEEALENA